MDDESFFGLSNAELLGNAGYYTPDSNLTSDEEKTKRKSKFEKKLLVWVAFSEKAFLDITYFPVFKLSTQMFMYKNVFFVK